MRNRCWEQLAQFLFSCESRLPGICAPSTVRCSAWQAWLFSLAGVKKGKLWGAHTLPCVALTHCSRTTPFPWDSKLLTFVIGHAVTMPGVFKRPDLLFLPHSTADYPNRLTLWLDGLVMSQLVVDELTAATNAPGSGSRINWRACSGVFCAINVLTHHSLLTSQRGLSPLSPMPVQPHPPSLPPSCPCTECHILPQLPFFPRLRSLAWPTFSPLRPLLTPLQNQTTVVVRTELYASGLHLASCTASGFC